MRKIENNRVLLVVTIVVLIVLVFGATYAYFVASVGTGASAGISVTANTTDSLMFEVGKDLNININQQNFGEGAGNKSDITTAKATLIANNKTNTASYNYYLYLNISKNEFVYTTEDKTPEILLQITKPDGTVLTSINGLNYVTIGDTSGFDITTKKGKITIADNKLIEVLESNATHKTEEEWNIKITFVNLDSNQQENTNKSFVSKVLIQKDELSVTLADHVISLYGVDEHLIHHDGSILNDNGEVIDANDGSYRYSGGDGFSIKLENIFVKRTVSTLDEPIYYYQNSLQEENINKFIQIMEKNEEDRSDEENIFYDDIVTKINGGEIDLFFNMYSAAANAKDKGLAITTINPRVNNFVCFGSDEEICPLDNLYRVIGVFGDQVKLIKFDFASKELLGKDGDYGDVANSASKRMTNLNLLYNEYRGMINAQDIGFYMYNYNGLPNHEELNEYGNNEWGTSLLNKVNLNTNFINNIGSKWKEKISDSIWYVGGIDKTNISIDNEDADYIENAREFYEAELGLYANKEKTVIAKVGLMYASDYLYGFDKKNWYGTKVSELLKNHLENWLHMYYEELLISPEISYSIGVSAILEAKVWYVYPYYGLPVRPAFYLNSNVMLISGEGTMSNPWRIS